MGFSDSQLDRDTEIRALQADMQAKFLRFAEIIEQVVSRVCCMVVSDILKGNFGNSE